MIEYKTPQEIAKIREAGRVVATILERIKYAIKPGITTKDLEKIAEATLKEFNARSAFKGYKPNGVPVPFPGLICTSVNEEVVHGIPSDRRLKDGDIVSVDVGVELDGYFADGAETFQVGRVNHEIAKLLETTKRALLAGILQAQIGKTLVDIASAIEKIVSEAGFSVVRDLVGHGVGKSLHEDPPVANFVSGARPIPLNEGMVIAIEPMVNLGNWRIKTLKDGWTVVTKDGKPSAHFEHSVAITNIGPLVLTRL